MNNQKKPIELVVCLIGNEYKRYEGKHCTHHIQSEEPLDSMRVETFRVDPVAVCGEQEPEYA